MRQGAALDREPWYGTQYSSQPLPRDWLARWEAAVPPSELRLPPPNPFVPTDFALLPASARSGAALSLPCPIQHRAVSGMAHAEEVALLFLTGCLCHAGRPHGVHASVSNTPAECAHSRSSG